MWDINSVEECHVDIVEVRRSNRRYPIPVTVLLGGALHRFRKESVTLR